MFHQLTWQLLTPIIPALLGFPCGRPSPPQASSWGPPEGLALQLFLGEASETAAEGTGESELSQRAGTMLGGQEQELVQLTG